ncbi:aconitate hydratase [Burkholderiales bacterium]|nr:aconitate hydratase [Burkholderiales bacterium]
MSGVTTSSGAGAQPRSVRFARVVAAGEELRVADVAGMLAERGLDVARVPYAARAILENLVRQAARNECEPGRLEVALDWRTAPAGMALPLAVSRIVMPDSSGLPVLADLASLRDVVAQAGGDPASVRLAVPAHLVVDHSVQVDVAGVPEALARNLDREFERNGERYRFLKWACQAFDGIRIVPPGIGIIHQIQVERLACPVALDARFDEPVAGAELVVGTDSHTPMVNGIGVIGWGVGGIEAETVLLGDPLVVPKPPCIGVRLRGRPPPGVTAADIALAVTERLRREAPVGAFVEFVGEGADALAVPDRATIANMAPEYGATMGYFPVDRATLAFLRVTGRSEDDVARTEAVARALRLFREPGDPLPDYDATIGIDLSALEPVMAGPRRPECRVALRDVAASFAAALARPVADDGYAAAQAADVECTVGGSPARLSHGFVAIAAITSCTNTSNPASMIAAALVARNARARGLSPAPWVKTSFAPGSRTVPRYLAALGLLEPLEALGFSVVGYGCTTCGGKSGPLDAGIADAVERHGLVAVAVLSGNRNFEGRIHRLVRAAYLGAPHLVVAYAIAGRIDADLAEEPLGVDARGSPVYYADIAPDPDEVSALAARALEPRLFDRVYSTLYDGPPQWQRLAAPTGQRFAWDPASTYLVAPPFFDRDSGAFADRVEGARVLCLMGDAVNTDHISPGGEIPADSAAGRYLIGLGVGASRFNTYVGRRGNPEVMRRATFAHAHFRNLLTPDRTGGWTRLLPDGDVVPIHEAADAYRVRGVPMIVVAGARYGTGSSRDWAAKGPALLGVRVVLASSFERIHRANLVGMGIVPLTFAPGEGWRELGLDGTETFDIDGLDSALAAGTNVRVRARRAGFDRPFETVIGITTASEARQLREGGIFRSARSRFAPARERSPAPG